MERVRQAFTLLDAAAAGKNALLQHRDLEKGFKDFMWRRDTFEGVQEILALMNDDPLVFTNSNGERRADFEGALKSFFGVGQNASRAERMERLLQYVLETEFNKSTQSRGISLEEAQTCMSDWQANGIDEYSYCFLKEHFASWWEFHVRRTKRENASVPKGKQGRVKRKNDKRRGARPPRLKDELKKK